MPGTTPIDVVKKFFEYLGTGNMEGVVGLFTDDGTIDMPGSNHLPWAGRWTGTAKLREYFVVMPKALDIRGATQTRWVAERNSVAVTGTEIGASRVSGKEYRAKWSWIFEIRDGRIALWDAYEDTEAMFSCAPWR